MAGLKVNRALWVIVVLVVAVGLFTFNMVRGNKTPQLIVKDDGEYMRRAPTPQTADADTALDTIAAIRGHVAGVEKKAGETRGENEILRDEREALIQENKELAKRFDSRLNSALQAQKEESEEWVTVLTEKIDALIESNDERQEMMSETLSRVTRHQNTQLSSESAFVGLDDLPGGFGGMYKKGDVISGKDSLDVFWIEPLDESLGSVYQDTASTGTEITMATAVEALERPMVTRQVLQPLEKTKASLADFINEGAYVPRGGRGRSLPRRGGLHRQVPNVPRVNDQSRRQTSAASPLPTTRQSISSYGVNHIDASSDPRFTIPDLSLLANSTAITALVGKVYLDNRVQNPRYFKVKVGRDNVTSNGNPLPREVAGTIMEGYAVGEYSTSCVRGVVTAATFVFRDGTVRSMYPGDVGSRPSSNAERMGYISDKWGNDCIPGLLISDGAKYLGTSFAAAGLAGYAQAWRIAQQNRREFLTPNGTSSTVTSVPGEKVREYAEASALAGGIEEVVKYVRERYGVSTDLVYLPAGQRIDVHIQQELRVDVAQNARKLRHHFRERSHVKSSFD